jgi:sugar phosphate permease
MAEPQRPTSVRWIILALTVVVAVLLYLDRYCLGYITPYVREGLRLSDGETGFMLGAFFLTYAVGQLPAGWLADRYGTRMMLTIYLAVWSVLTALIGFANSFAVLLLLRFGCGLFEAGGYPACAGLIRRWIPYHQRGLASGIVSMGGRIGGAITPAITGFFILLFMPVSAPSLIVDPERDILDARGFARDVLLLDDAGKKPTAIVQDFAPRLQAKLSPAHRDLLAEIARSDAPPSKDQLDGLAAVINAGLQDPLLLRGADLDAVRPKLTRQALLLLDDRATPGDEHKTARLNRSVLEVVFPGRIRQVLGDGWPPVLMIYGVIGVVMAGVFFAFYRDTPRQHFLANEAEARLAEAHEKANEDGAAPIPAATLWGSILTDRSLWASSVVQFGTNFGWIILGNQLALYLYEVHQVPEGFERRTMASLPFFFALPALIVGGWWTDWMTKRYGPRLGRCFPIAATRFATAAAFAVCLLLDDAWLVIVVLSTMSMVHDMGLPAIWGYNLDVGKRNVGVVLGWGNMWGNLGAFVSPVVLLPLTSMFATKKAGYDALFLTCAAVFALIGVVSLFIDATSPIGGAPPVPPSDAIREGEPPMLRIQDLNHGEHGEHGGNSSG